MVTSLHSFGQINPLKIQKHDQDSILYVQESIEFIKKVKGGALQEPMFILSDKPFAFNYFDCLTQLLADSTTFSKDELNFIRHKSYPSVTYWTKSFFPTTKLVSTDTIDSIFKSHSDG